MFVPLTIITPSEVTTPISYTFGFMDVLTTSAPIVATAVNMGMDKIVSRYLSLRLGLTGLLFIVGFVMSRIRRGQQITSNFVMEYRRNWK